MKLSIIIPTYNESTTIRELVSMVNAVHYPIEHEIIIVDDASIDRTHEKSAVLKRQSPLKNIRYFKNRFNQGKGYSVRRGIQRARGDFIVVQDADHEYNPEEIPQLLEPLLRGSADVVYGSRFIQKSRPKNMAFPNWIANIFLTKLTNWLYGLQLTDMETCYKVFRADVLKQVRLRANRFTFEPEVTALLARRKIRIAELPISYSGRTAKEGKKIKARDFVFAVLTLIKYKIVR